MITQLKEIAKVQMGYTFRTGLVSDKGDTKVIQMKDIQDNDTVNCASLTGVAMKSVKEQHLVHDQDLVFRSRGQLPTSAIITNPPPKTIVSAPLLRIRVDDRDVIRPAYLNWFMNQRDAQRYFLSRSRGTAMLMVSRNTVAELEVKIPPVAVQDTIIEVAALEDREQQILNETAAKRNRLIEAQLRIIVEGA